jgi:thioredoxin 1
MIKERMNMTDSKVVHLTKNDFDSTIATGVTLVDFWAPWCGPCRMVGPVLDEISMTLSDKAKICKVNVDNDQELAVRYGVRGIPTVIVFKDGKIVSQAVGARGKADYEKMISGII